MRYSSAVLFTATLSTPLHPPPPPLHTGTRISVLLLLSGYSCYSKNAEKTQRWLHSLEFQTTLLRPLAKKVVFKRKSFLCKNLGILSSKRKNVL